MFYLYDFITDSILECEVLSDALFQLSDKVLVMFGFIADLLGKLVTELVIGSIHNIYTFLLIALDAASVAFIMQKFLKFNKVISWLIGLLVLVWLSEHIIVRKSS